MIVRTGCATCMCNFTILGKNKTEVKYLFKHRKDLLNARVEAVKSGEVQESFGPGRERSLKGNVKGL